MKWFLKSGFAVCLLVFCAVVAVAAPPPFLADLMYQSEAWARDQMGRRGYSVARSQYNDVFWWNRNTRSCVVITVDRGRVIEVSELARQQCEGSGGATQLPDSPGMAAVQPANMAADCRSRVNKLLRADFKKIEVKYEGRRADGTHAVNGSARIGGERVQLQCNFTANGYLNQIVVRQ